MENTCSWYFKAIIHMFNEDLYLSEALLAFSYYYNVYLLPSISYAFLHQLQYL